MPEKLKVAIRLSAETEAAVKALAEIKRKSEDTRRSLSASAQRASHAWSEAQKKLHRAAKQGQAKDILGLKPDQKKREIQRIIAALNRLKRSAHASMTDIGRATDAARKRIKQLRMATDQAAKSQSILGRHLKYMIGLGLGGATTFGAGGVYRLADAHVELNNRLRLVTHSEANLTETRRRLYEISQITRTQIGANAALYSKFAMATQETGHSQADLLEVISLLNKQVAIGGSNAAEAAAGLLQFGQGLASGKLAGDELRSVLENLLGVSDGLIAGFEKLRKRSDIAFEVTRGNIRQLAAEGKLSAHLLIEAILASAEDTEHKFRKVEKTMKGGWTQVGNAVAILVGQINDAFEGAQSFSDLLGTIAARIGEVDGKALGDKIKFLKYVISALVVLITTRLSAALVKSATNWFKLSGALGATQASMNSTSAATKRLAIAMGVAKRAARGLWAAIGGLIGIAGLLAYGIYAIATAHKSAAKATNKHTESVEALRHQIQGLPQDAAAAIRKLSQMSDTEVEASRAAYKIRAAQAADRLKAARAALSQADTLGIQDGTKRVQTSGRSTKTVPAYRSATADERATLLADIQKSEVEHKRLLGIIDQHTHAIEGTGLVAKTAGQRITAAMKKAGEAFDELTKKISKSLLSDRGRLEAEIKAQLAIIKKSGKPLLQQQALEAKARALYQQRIAALDEAAAETALRIKLSSARAQLSLTKDGLQRQQSALERALDGRLISIADYYRKKAALDIQAIDAEIALKRQDKPSPESAIEIQRLEIQRENILADSAREAKMAQDDLAESLRQVRYELQRLQGQGAITREALAAEYADLRARLMAEDDTEGMSLIDQLIDVRHAEQRLQALEQTWRAAQERLRVQQETVNIDQDAGLITETEARARLLQLKRESREEMERLLPLMQQAALALGPEAVTRVQQFRNALGRIKNTTDQVAAALNQKLKDGFAQMFSDIATGTKTAGQALKGMIRSFAMELNKLLAKKLVQKLFGMALGGAGGAGGAGGLITKFLGFAQGGLVRGPGTSTSDDVPAMLSSGEFVLRAAAVKQWGVDFLEAINSIEPGGPSPRLAMAAGGLVPAQAPAPVPEQSVRIVNVIDEKLAGDYLASSEGEQTILNILERNRGAVKQVLV